MLTPITHKIKINLPVHQVWELWTQPVHLAQWNNIDENWHTPFIEMDLIEDGHFIYRMESKDGSEGFDHKGKYDVVQDYERIEYTLSDGRRTINTFIAHGGATFLTETFDPETNTPLEVQKDFCLKILQSFKAYAESTKLNLF